MFFELENNNNIIKVLDKLEKIILKYDEKYFFNNNKEYIKTHKTLSVRDSIQNILCYDAKNNELKNKSDIKCCKCAYCLYEMIINKIHHQLYLRRYYHYIICEDNYIVNNRHCDAFLLRVFCCANGCDFEILDQRNIATFCHLDFLKLAILEKLLCAEDIKNRAEKQIKFLENNINNYLDSKDIIEDYKKQYKNLVNNEIYL